MVPQVARARVGDSLQQHGWGRNPSDRMFSDGRRLLDIRTIPLSEPATQLQTAAAGCCLARAT
jgi:hypothetical protein